MKGKHEIVKMKLMYASFKIANGQRKHSIRWDSGQPKSSRNTIIRFDLHTVHSFSMVYKHLPIALYTYQPVPLCND